MTTATTKPGGSRSRIADARVAFRGGSPRGHRIDDAGDGEAHGGPVVELERPQRAHLAPDGDVLRAPPADQRPSEAVPAADAGWTPGARSGRQSRLLSALLTGGGTRECVVLCRIARILNKGIIHRKTCFDKELNLDHHMTLSDSPYKTPSLREFLLSNDSFLCVNVPVAGRHEEIHR